MSDELKRTEQGNLLHHWLPRLPIGALALLDVQGNLIKARVTVTPWMREGIAVAKFDGFHDSQPLGMVLGVEE